MGIAVGQLTLAFAVIACTIVHVHLARFTPRSDGIKNSIRAEGEMSDLSMQMLYNGHGFDVNEHDTQLPAVTAATVLQAKRDRRVLLVPPQFSHRISRRQAETTGNRGTQVKRDTLISKVAIENRNAVLLIDNNDDQTDSSNFPQISGQSSENATESNDLSQQTQPSDFFELHDDSSAESLQSQIRRGALAMTDSGSEGKAEEPDDQNKVETKKMETIKEKIIEEIDQPTDQSDSLEQKPNDSKADDSNKDENQNSQTIGALPSSSVEADDKAATRRKRDVSADWQFDNGLPHSGYIQTLQHSSQIQRQIEPLTPNDTIFPMLEQQQQPYSQQEFYVVEHFPAPQQQDQRQNQQHNQQQNQQLQSQQQPHQLSPYLKPQEASWTSKLQQQLLPQQQRQQQQQQEQQQWLASKDDKSIREELANIRKDLSDIWLATVLTAELEMARQSAILTAKSQIIEFGNNSDEDNMIVEQQKHARHGRKKLSTHEHSNGRPSIGGWLPVALIKASPTPSPIPAPIPLPIPSPGKPFLVPAPNDSTDSAEDEDNGWKFVSKKSSPTSETPRRKVSVAPWRSVPSGQMRSVRSGPKSIGKHKKLLNAQLIEDDEDEIQPKIWRRRQLPATIQSETREFFDKDIDKTDFISTGAGHVPSDNKEDGGNTVIAITDKVMIPQDPQVQDAQGQPSNIEPLPFPSEGQKPLKA